MYRDFGVWQSFVVQGGRYNDSSYALLVKESWSLCCQKSSGDRGQKLLLWLCCHSFKSNSNTRDRRFHIF